MSRSFRPLMLAACLVLPASTGSASAADLPFRSSPPLYAAPRYDGGGGFRVAAVAVRPAPSRYDIYGYPVLAGVPNPLAVSSGCPAAIQPNYDVDGNFAGYAPIPMCR